jgi:penicillin-binding protein 1A
VVYSAAEPQRRAALDPRVAYIVRDILREATDRGSGAAARHIVPPHIAIAGKTGTSNDNVDVWFVGMTPTLVAGVWLGFDKPRTIMPGVGGGALAAPIWAHMVRRYYGSRSAGDWALPPDLPYAEMDRSTGAMTDADTPPERRYLEYFLPGTEPPLIRVKLHARRTRVAKDGAGAETRGGRQVATSRAPS